MSDSDSLHNIPVKKWNKMNLKVQLCLKLLILPMTQTIIFKENAADYIEADYKTIVRMGVSKDDFTKLEISAKPLLMVIKTVWP